MRRKLNILIALTLLFLFSTSIFAQSKPADVIKSFYKFHNSRNGILSLHELKLHKRFFTNELYKLFLYELKRQEDFARKNPSEKPHFGDGLPFKPFDECVIANRIFLNLYEISEISADANKAIVEVKFFVPKECEDQADEKLIDAYKIELLKKGKVWLINDWFYSDDTKLSEDLKREKY